MHPRASILIDILRDSLHQIEQNSRFYADDPTVLELKTSILHGIAALETLLSNPDLEAA